MSQRRSIPALNLLKQQHERKIENYHKPRQRYIVDSVNEICNKQAKEIIKDIEDYATRKYPSLKLLLKCESGHSQFNNNIIEVGFKFYAIGVEKQRASMEKLKLEESKDRKDLEEWYTRFLSSMAGGEELPEFGPDHLKDVSSEYVHRYQSDYTI
jgi:hypothetical protein